MGALPNVSSLPGKEMQAYPGLGHAEPGHVMQYPQALSKA